jgi:Flp pilus assembly protein TadG
MKHAHIFRNRPPARSTFRGVIAVEFALVLIPMLLMLAGIVEFGRAMWHANVLTKATRDGARVISDWAPADLQQGISESVNRVVVTANASRLSPPVMATDVAVECDYSPGPAPAFNFTTCSTTTAPKSVRIRMVGYSFALGQWMPFIGPNGLLSLGTVTLTPATTMPYMRSST